MLVQARPYHLYMLRSDIEVSVRVNGVDFVAYNEKYLDPRRRFEFLRIIGDMCRWVNGQCFRQLVYVVMAMTRRNAKPERVYRMLQVLIRKTSVII